MKKFTGGKSHYLFIILAFLMGGALSIGFLNLKSHLPIYAKTITIGQPVTLSGTNTISAGKFLDTANSAYFLDPASSTNALIVNGKIGIGTTAPSQLLDVAGTANMTTLAIGGTSVTATAAELNYVDNVTSAIQTQLGLKAPLASPTFTGTVTVPTPLVAGAAATKDYADAAGAKTVIVTSCGWITSGASGAVPAVGSCTPTACPSGYTDNGIIGCYVTALVSCTAQGTLASNTSGSHWYATYSSYWGDFVHSGNNCGGAGGKCERACTL